MANDADWVADVRRWYLASRQAAVESPVEDDSADIGYEAADPALQSRHWPEMARCGAADLA